MNQENIDVKEKIASFFRNTFERRDARIIAVIVILALIAGIVIATTRGGDSNEASVSDGLNGLSPVTDYVFQPNDSLGPDPFGPSFATYTVEVPTEELSTGTVSSDSTGLYGGTGENSCDVEKMIEFLMNNPDRAAAWAGVQGIAVDEIPDYLNSLTAVVLLENVLVVNHGYSDGEATPFLAVLEAGTAVLVDEDGIPRARCACGNPLTPPEEPPTTEETTTTVTSTSEPDITTTENPCPEFDGEPPYGFTQEADGKWTLHTPDGRFVWDPTAPGWQPLPDDGSGPYLTESDVPGYDEECWPCPPESSGESDAPSYEKDDDGKYKSSPDMLEKEGAERTAMYVVVKAFTNSSGTTTTEDSNADDDPEVYEPSFDIEEIDPETTEEFEPEYDDEYEDDSKFDWCFPPCPEDGEWGWKIQARPDGNSSYVWVAPDGTNWYWVDGAWEEGPEIIPLSDAANGPKALFVGSPSEDGPTYSDYKDLPGWSEDCFECPPWGWVETEDGIWEWHDPSGTIWTANIYGEWISGEEVFVGGMSLEGLNMTELPGYDEDCHECPEWGWTQTEDGSWVWVAPDGTEWGIIWTTSGWVWSYETVLDGKIPGIENITDLPGYIEDCEECPEWGWNDVHDLHWSGPDGNHWFASMGGTWKAVDPDTGALIGEVSTYKDLPGYIEECNECPPWGWIEQEDGSWFWDGGLEVGWTFQFYSGVGQWVSEEGTYPYNDYKDLPNFDPDCHECPEWGWAPEGDIWYWVDPNGVTWIPDADSNWYPEDGAYPDASLNIVYSPDRLPGWYEDCHDCGGFGWNDDDGDGIWVWVDPTGVTWTEYADGLWYPDNGADPIGFYTRLPGWDDNCHEGPPGETTTTSTTSTTTTTTTTTTQPGDAPDAPTLVSLLLWDETVGVDWREPTYEGTAPITDFVIQAKAGSAGAWTTVDDGVSAQTYGIVSGLTNGTEYFFRVAGVNSVGVGDWSNELSDIPFDFDPYNFDANGNQGTRFIYWNKPTFPDTPGNTLYQLGVLVNDTGSIQATNKSTSTAGGGTFDENLMVNKDSYGNGTLLNCTDSYDFYVRVINTDFLGSTVVTDWVNGPELMNYSYNGSAGC